MTGKRRRLAAARVSGGCGCGGRVDVGGVAAAEQRPPTGWALVPARSPSVSARGEPRDVARGNGRRTASRGGGQGHHHPGGRCRGVTPPTSGPLPPSVGATALAAHTGDVGSQDPTAAAIPSHRRGYPPPPPRPRPSKPPLSCPNRAIAGCTTGSARPRGGGHGGRRRSAARPPRQPRPTRPPGAIVAGTTGEPVRPHGGGGSGRRPRAARRKRVRRPGAAAPTGASSRPAGASKVAGSRRAFVVSWSRKDGHR